MGSSVVYKQTFRITSPSLLSPPLARLTQIRLKQTNRIPFCKDHFPNVENVRAQHSPLPSPLEIGVGATSHEFIYNKTLDILSKSAFYFAIWTTLEA